MTPQSSPPDPDFVKALSSNIHGIYAVQIERFSAVMVELEFRRIIQQPRLTSDDGLMDNLMFVVRKKDILTLRADVESVLQSLSLPPHAELSALKTLYALGGERERRLVDDRYARILYADLKTGDGIPTGPFLPSAAAIGGQKTLSVLQAALPAAAARQSDAETKTPGNHVRIGQLDKVRSSIDDQSVNLKRKMELAASPEPKRTTDMLQAILRRSPALGAWSYVELVNHPSPASIEAIRGFLALDIGSLPPAALPEEDRRHRVETARMECLLLLRAMKASLSPEEEALVKPHLAITRPDWEDVLDRN